MHFHLLCVGKKPRDWVRTACEEYVKRLTRGVEFKLVDISPASSEPNRKSIEAKRLIDATPKGFKTIALDEHGELWSSSKLARRLEGWRDDGIDIACYIGGADGLDKSLLDEVGHRWSLSPLTLPHQLARIVVIEQLYRAQSILENHPYHRP